MAFTLTKTDQIKITDIIRASEGEQFDRVIKRMLLVFSVLTPEHYGYAGYLYGVEGKPRTDKLNIDLSCLNLN